MRSSTVLTALLCLTLLISIFSVNGKGISSESWTEGYEWEKELSTQSSTRSLQAGPLGASDAMVAHKCVFIFATGRQDLC